MHNFSHNSHSPTQKLKKLNNKNTSTTYTRQKNTNYINSIPPNHPLPKKEIPHTQPAHREIFSQETALHWARFETIFQASTSSGTFGGRDGRFVWGEGKHVD